MVNDMTAAVVVAGGFAMALACMASAAEQPAAARYYAFLGHWKGQDQLTETGKKPIVLGTGARSPIKADPRSDGMDQRP